jgi:transcriptional regulator with GAF, ATPase, and Fis domain
MPGNVLHQTAFEDREPVTSPMLRDCGAASRGAWWSLDNPRGPLREVAHHIREVADTPLSVLIEGESGTGKELVARAIHQLSLRRDRPLITVDCGAIPDTLIESELFGHERGAFTGAVQRRQGEVQVAEGGTLFLDEVSNLPLTAQPKLLRALQERQMRPLGSDRTRPFDVRVVVASQIPLTDLVAAGRFRLDLYYRLNEFQIALPPLRECDDLLELAHEFVVEAGRELGRAGRVLSAEAAARLHRYPWPGNVRELRNVIRRAVLLSRSIIEPDHLGLPGADALLPSASVSDLEPPPMSLKNVAAAAAAHAEEKAIEAALMATRGNKSRSARLLQIDYKTLLVKLKRYRINIRRLRADQTPQDPDQA